MIESKCLSCSFVREIVSGTGSKFWLCELSQTDRRFAKYPPQPVATCEGYQSIDQQGQPERFTMEALDGSYAICRLAAADPLPDWAQGEFVSVTRTKDELSVVCLQSQVPDSVQTERNWRTIKIIGPLDFSMTGVIASLTTLLSDVDISVFVVSTFDTDYLLVKAEKFAAAVETLQQAGTVN